MHIVGWVIALLTILIVAVNAAFMLTSPKAWFKLPGWILAKGGLTEGKYSTGWGALQVRILGAIILGVIGWALIDISSK